MLTFFPLFVILNVLCVFGLYALLCNTALITKREQNNGYFIYDKEYIIGDFIKMNGCSRFWLYGLCVLLCCVPFTWWLCAIISLLILVGYDAGMFDVFGKNKIDGK